MDSLWSLPLSQFPRVLAHDKIQTGTTHLILSPNRKKKGRREKKSTTRTVASDFEKDSVAPLFCLFEALFAQVLASLTIKDCLILSASSMSLLYYSPRAHVVVSGVAGIPVLSAESFRVRRCITCELSFSRPIIPVCPSLIEVCPAPGIEKLETMTKKARDLFASAVHPS